MNRMMKNGELIIRAGARPVACASRLYNNNRSRHYLFPCFLVGFLLFVDQLKSTNAHFFGTTKELSN